MAETNWIPSQRSGRASQIGVALGGGVSQGLETIVKNMAQQKAEKIRAGHLKTLQPGLTDVEAAALAGLGPNAYEGPLKGRFGETKESNTQLDTPQGPSVGTNNTSSASIKPIDFLKAMGPLGLNISPEQEKQINSLPENLQRQLAQKAFESLAPQQRQQVGRELLAQQQLQQQQPQQVIGSQEPGVAPQQPKRVGFGESLRNAEGRGTARLEFDKEKEKAVQDRYAHKANAKFVHETLGLQKAKHEEDNILKRIIKVSEKEGSDVRNPVLTGIMRDIGIDYQGLKSGDTLEIDKLGRWFLRGGSKMFGGRVSNAEMYAILDQVPTALQTKEGRVRLAKQMLLANKDYHDEVKVMKSVIKENKGKYPLDLELQVDERMEPIRERNAHNFINGIYNGGSSEKISDSFKVGQKISASQLSSLPEGTIYKKDGKRFEIKDGKEVAL